MRFMTMVKADPSYEAGDPPSPELMEAIGALAEESARAGVLLEMGGLLPTRAGARIRVSRGKLKVIDGPFSEAKEVIGGYAILQVASKEEAIEQGKRFMALHARILPTWEGELEIRQLEEFEAQS